MEGTGITNFFEQIVGLLIVTFVAGVLWIGLTVLILRRAAERRRRKREGLENLPSFYSQAVKWIRQQLEGAPQQSTAPAVPMPDIAAILSPLPTPDLDSLLSEIPSGEQEIEPEIVAHPSPAVNKAAQAEPIATLPIKDAPLTQTQLPPDAVEMMRVWRDLSSNNLIVEMRGQYLGDHAALKAANLQARFASLIEELQRFGQIAPPAAAEQVAKPKRTPKQAAPVAAAAPLGGMSMAEQIEELLQRKLLAQPEFADSSIHVRPSPSSGVHIEVNGELYDAVSDIPDENIRAMIQSAIEEWEKHA